MEEYSGYVGLDVHKETISPALANPGRSKPESLGVIANTKKSIQNLVHRLSREGEVLGFCYEAGPCGYEVYRWIKETGHDCVVVAPSLIPKKPGERVKTDRRDGLKLASLFRSGELTPVWVCMLFFILNREDFSFVIHLDRQPRTSRRREAQTGSRARSGSRSERTLDAVEHSRTLMEWWPFLIFHRGGLRIKVINNSRNMSTTLGHSRAAFSEPRLWWGDS